MHHKFIVDVQLPKSLSKFLNDNGYDSTHILELSKGNRTSDAEIIEFSIAENRIVITKDYDFYESKLINNVPEKIVFVITGNIANQELIALFEKYLQIITELLLNNDIEEIDRISIKAR